MKNVKNADGSRSQRFEMGVDSLVEIGGIDGLNDYLQELIDSKGLKHYATDIGYEFVGIGVIEATYVPERP